MTATAGTTIAARDPLGQVQVEDIGGHVRVITVDRQEKRNAFTPKLMRELAETLTIVDDDPDAWAVALLFAGPHACAGLDMTMFFTDNNAPSSTPADRVDPFGMNRRMTTPIVAAVHGVTYTVGIEIALACDIIVAADDTRFCQLEGKRGLAPLGGATFRFVERAGWGNAMYHLLRVDEFDAQEALRIGLVQEVVPAGTQRDRAITIAAEIATNAPLGMRYTKSHARLALDHGEHAAVDAIPAMRAHLMTTRDLAEGINAFIQRRAASFTGE